MTLRCLITEPERFSDDAIATVRALSEVQAQSVSRETLLRIIPDYDILWVRLAHRIDEEVLAAGAKLKAIVTATTGLNHIDLDAATRSGVEVLSLRGERQFLDTVSATAELTWGLLLALTRRIPWSFDSVRAGDWVRDPFAGIDLRDRTLGVIGYGRLGAMVAAYAQAFGMIVVACDPSEAAIPAWIKPCTLEEALACADIVTLHVPLNDTTEGIIGVKELAVMKPGSLLINTSRGEIVDETALLRALERGHLGGAALDVIAQEQQGAATMASRPLVEYARAAPNLLITPHIGGASRDAMARTELFMANKLRHWVARSARLDSPSDA